MNVRVRGIHLDPAVLQHELDLRAWTQADLAQRTGLSPTVLVGVLRGKPCSRRTALRIAEALVKEEAHPELARLLAS